MAKYSDEYYLDILDGLARHLESPFIADVLTTASRDDTPHLGSALNKNQVAGKKWLVQALHQTAGAELGTVYILGGWYGTLAAMLLHDRRFVTDQVLGLSGNLWVVSLTAGT